jgi:CubicO group peptidase (beta-lactamase class C family)
VNYLIRITVIVIAASLCGRFLVAAAEINGDPAEGRAIDAIFQQWSSPNVPGCALALERKGEPVFTRGYGMADLEHDVPITPATVFEAGSVSKQFTAAAILLLAAQEKLALTDDVHKYVPELPDYGTPITINELLGHTSGARDWGEVEAMAGWPRGSRIYTPNDALDVITRQKSLNFKPGTAYSYTNTGYNLLAIIVERVSKTSLAEYTRNQFFVPLGMVNTQWRDDFRRVVKGRAIAYEAMKDTYRQEMPFEDVYGNGGLLTTVGDLLIWNDALATGKLGAIVTAELQRPTRLEGGRQIGYARGLFLRQYQGLREISHDGSTAGYRAWLGRFPDQQLSIALLCNSDAADSSKLAHQVADLFLAVASPPQTSITLNGAELAPYTGVFVDQHAGLTARLTVRDESLWLGAGRRLTPTSTRDFRVGTSSMQYTGFDAFSVQTAAGDAFHYQRVQPWSPTPNELAALAGRYTSDEALATYRVSVTRDGVVLTPRDRQSKALILKPLFADTFEWGDSDDGIVRFVHDRQGRITAFEISNSRVHALSFRKDKVAQ